MMLKETGTPKSKDEGIDAAWITFADAVAAALSDKHRTPLC